MVPIDVVNDICRHYVNDQSDVDPALIKRVDGYRRAKNVAGLASCSLHFDKAKHSVGEWRFLKQVEAFYKKNASLSVSADCKQAAYEGFLSSEELCSETNRRLAPYIRSPLGLPDPQLDEWVLRMKRYISNVLGDFHLFAGELAHLVKVTPGATAHSARRDSLPQLKMRMQLYATRNAAPYLEDIYREFGFNPPRVKVTHRNRVELVPKNWKTDRTIACEPEGNLPLQLAVDTYVKRRLRRFGINLSDQSANQKLAKHASIHNDFVTVDFASASDTIAFNTVSWLLPPDWFSYLLDVRSPGYRGAFGEGTYAKFSSMGNGSTFVLETLLFAAACYAVGSKEFLVYGDDVIIGKEYYEDYQRLTRFLGFVVNTEKSFHDGPFRESCGLDVYDGIDVTPVYIRSLDSRKAVLCHLVNSLGALTFPGSKLGAYLCDLVTEAKLPFVPYSESSLSGVWIDPQRARALGVLRRRNGVDSFRAYVAKNTHRKFVDSRGYYLWFLHKNSQVLFGGPWELSRPSYRATQTSSVPVFQHCYVRRRVGWQMPAEAVPEHLIWCPEKL